MVVPDGVVQAERLVALAPAVARPLVFLDDDGGNAKLPEPRTERNAALATADDDAIRLPRETQLGGLLLSLAADPDARGDVVFVPPARLTELSRVMAGTAP